MSATQTVTVKIEISGPQTTTITTTDAGHGGHISVVTGLVMVTLYDRAAADTYTGAWTHPVDIARLLPTQTNPLLPANSTSRIRNAMTAAGPGILIEARGSDHVKHGYDGRQKHMIVQIGTLTWIVSDAQAYQTMANTYRRVHQLAQLILTDNR